MENTKQASMDDAVTVVAADAHVAATIINIPAEASPSTSEGDTAMAPPVPSTTTTPLPTPTTTPAKSTSQLYAAASITSLAYDTDCSVASSTCCTRYGEHIYMQRCAIDMLEHEQQHQHQQHKSNATATVAVAATKDVDYVKPEQYKNKWPIFIVLISLVEIAIFVYDYLSMQMATPANATQSAEQQAQGSLLLPVPIPTDSVFIYRPDRRLEVWRFVSYMFLHANSFHLGFNVVVQLFYGVPLEVMHGSARVAIIYFAGVFAGSLGTSVVDSEVYLVGASGGVYALLAAHLANITLNFGQMRYAVAQLFSVVIFVTCDLAYAVYTQYLAVDVPSKTPPVSYIAHLTGALAGLTIGLLVLKNFEQRAYENVIWWLALGIYSAFTIFAVMFNLINTVTAQLMEEQGEVITQHLLHDLGVS